MVHPAGAIRGRPEEVDASLRAIADDDGRDGADREVAASFLPFLGADDPGPGIARRRHGRGFSYTTPAFDLSA
ncbi:MAG TPA: hypothetical protein VEP73_08095 [Actinomycetota bacterium]|nr:hypothetical protein [Actinomycetota bacterium]